MPATTFPIKASVLTALLIATGILGLALSIRVHASPSSPTLFGRINAPSGWGFTSTAVTSPGPDITVLPGETVDITIKSGDGFTHNWGVDYNGNGIIDTGEPLSNNTATSTSFTFTATTTPGQYTYWCFIHKGPMTGKFIVESPDFTITPSPSSLSINQGSFQTSTLTVSSVNGFSGTVTFSPPSPPSGVTATLSTSMVSITPTSSGTTVLNVTVGASTTPGSYTVSATGSGGGKSHTANVAVTAVGPDFAVSMDQSSLSVTIGSSGNATVTVTSQNGFSGIVNLAATVSPSGPAAFLSSAMVTLTAGGSTTSKLTITTASGTSSSVSRGSYTVTVTGTGGSSLSHSTSLLLTVSSPSSPAAPIPSYVLAIAGVTIVAGVAVTVVVVLRKRRPK
jgi:hypothetical protein